MSTATTTVIHEARELEAAGRVREAIDLLTAANRAQRSADIERALVRTRRDGRAALPDPPDAAPFAPIVPSTPTGDLFEVTPDQLDAAAVRAGFAQSGCVVIRGLLTAERAAELASGIDAALQAFDDAEAGIADVDPGWYSPFTMPDRSPQGPGSGVRSGQGAKEPKHIPERLRRRFIREGGGLWTAESPRMLFELFEMVEQTGIGRLMVDFLGERPFLSANKCTLRRVPTETVTGGWHQDGAFLGEDVGAFNLWTALTDCGRDAPGLDIVPRRVDRVLVTGDQGAQFDWSLSDATVAAAAADTPVVRPEIHAGDAIVFDHLLVHRTAASDAMTRPRHAIEAWFFGPSRYPGGQLPLVY
jgi:hypothetical protein